MRYIAWSFLWLILYLGAPAIAAPAPASAFVLDPEAFRHYVEHFNGMVEEGVVNHIPNAEAWAWLKENVPFFACPDQDVEQIYYYRWWVYRKHIKKTPAGFIVTEFIRPVSHATDYNAISCALGHHIAEGRWLRDPQYLDQYIRFWLTCGDNGGLQRHFHKYSGWAAAAVYDRWLVDHRTAFPLSLLDSLVLDYTTWEKERLLGNGLFWQYDVRDGMEDSVSGSRTAKNARPTINSYMYGNARALAAMAALACNKALARDYEAKAGRLRELVEQRLWDSQDAFFKALLESGRLADVREIAGFTPWYFNLPEADKGYERAWKQLMDPKGFYAPFGPTTAEQRHPAFRVASNGDDCQWNGPSWPFATTVTLRALANVLNDYSQQAITKQDYFKTFLVYTRSHRLQRDGGVVIPWIDEDLNPFTGEWQARSMKIKKGTFNGRGDHYNHSAYCDLVISGLVGLRPRPDDVVEVSPLLPPDAWDWFCLDNVPYHGHTLTVLWDRKGRKYGKGAGLRVFADSREVARAATLERVTGRLR
jgi:hypothetical protein